MPKKDSELAAASSTASLGLTTFWVIVDKLGASVKMTLTQLQTNFVTLSSIVGDVAASMVAGVATTTIGASKVVTSMIANAAVTYAKIQDVSATSKLLGRYSTGAGVVQELGLSPDFTLSGTTFGITPAVQLYLTPSVLGSDTSVATTTLTNVSGLSMSVAANTNYCFEFYILHTAQVTPRITVTTPASPTMLYFQVTYGLYGTTTQTSATPDPSERITTSGGGAGAATAPGDTTEVHHTTITGVLRNGANAGSIQLQACGKTSATSWTIKRGSFGRAQAMQAV